MEGIYMQGKQHSRHPRHTQSPGSFKSIPIGRRDKMQVYIGGYGITVEDLGAFLEQVNGPPEEKLRMSTIAINFERWYNKNRLYERGIPKFLVYQDSEDTEILFIYATHNATGWEEIPEYDDAKKARDELVNAMGHGFTAEKMRWMTVPHRKIRVWQFKECCATYSLLFVIKRAQSTSSPPSLDGRTRFRSAFTYTAGEAPSDEASPISAPEPSEGTTCDA
ncbi:hypothetical protein EVG20_g9101 [Dentipellis fragilis]|uniref:Uncharacterized protein n=1 Tax=Dentipellis fragilis TaxID=205917 RepID=A0A4Y9Y0W2_9AGAM|nr:hypothetical protein EVG20_g9101 [Dentipellis fragilis]